MARCGRLDRRLRDSADGTCPIPAAAPAWSPSGGWILARKGGELWVLRADGTAAWKLPSSGAAATATWSPKADRLAYWDESGRVVTGSADGSAEQSLTTGANTHVQRMAWSPDGRWLGFDQTTRTPGMHPGAPHCSASLAADGLALYSIHPGDPAPRLVVDSMLLHPDFLASRASGRLAAVRGSGRITWANKGVVVAKAAGAALTPVSAQGVAAISPAWSPDGHTLAYVAMPDAGTAIAGGEAARTALMGRRIWTAATAAETRQVTANAAYRDEAPRWTGDGRQLLFARISHAGSASLWLAPVQGGAPEPVADLDFEREGWFGFYGWIDWSQQFDYHPTVAR